MCLRLRANRPVLLGPARCTGCARSSADIIDRTEKRDADLIMMSGSQSLAAHLWHEPLVALVRGRLGTVALQTLHVDFETPYLQVERIMPGGRTSGCPL